MNLLKSLGDLVTGGLAKEAIEAIKDYFPPDMTPQQQADMELALQKVEQRRRDSAAQAAADAEERFNQRIKALEGTASDLRTIPLLGPIVLFLRGCQRPLWGFATLWLDWCWFSAWTLTDKQQSALIVINVLVLGFLFGERTVKNLQPLIVQVFGGSRAKGAGDG